MVDDPVTGPISKELFKKLADAPFGEATKTIRQHDPLWGRAEGEKIEWIITVQREVTGLGTAIIKAASENEANDLADDLVSSEIDWDDVDINWFEVVSVEPKKASK